MNPEKLDDDQRAVVDWILNHAGRALVLGGPGTGKTTTALCAARAVLEFPGTPPESRVLFLTFSRSAVSQITSRGQGILGSYDDRVEVFTFHALAFRLLRAFGRYQGLGLAPPVVQSRARVKLLGATVGNLSYDDLIPKCLALLAACPALLRLLRQRWPLTICDEVQDTSPAQWELIKLLARDKVLLIGDPDQLIYTFIDGVSPQRFQDVRLSADKVFVLPEKSHRDPSGVIPAVARAVRLRRFDDPSIEEALQAGRLKVVTYDGEFQSLQSELANQIRDLRKQKVSDIGVFAHSNVTTAEIGQLLHHEGIDHEIVGLPEAHAEALGAMLAQVRYAVGVGDEAGVREGFGCFLTASVRGGVPSMALDFVGGSTLPSLVDDRLRTLLATLKGTDWRSLEDLLKTVAVSWDSLALVEGRRNWTRAFDHMLRLAADYLQVVPTAGDVERLATATASARGEALLSMSPLERGGVRLMNFHQTKGKEADAVIHVFTGRDWFGHEREPFIDNSRLLGVAVSRARKTVIVILPPNPHPLVAPLLSLSGE